MLNNIFATYPGGKNGSGVYQKIISLMPPHTLYIEPFLGGGAILRAKLPAPANIGIDVDGAVIREWQLFPPTTIPNLTILQGDAITWLQDHASQLPKTALVYCDPPYLLSTRSKQQQLYTFELSENQEHRSLLDVLVKLDCMVMISGYWSQLYADLLPNWRTFQFQTVTRGGTTALETVWLNFPEPVELHDYRFLGKDYRERERIRRKKARWIEKLNHMPALERQALLMAIKELGSGSTLPGDTAGSTGDLGVATRITIPGSTAGNDVAPDDVTRADTPIYSDAGHIEN